MVRIDVEVRVELLDAHLEPAAFEQRAEGGGRQAFAEGGDDSSGDENVFHGAVAGRGKVVKKDKTGWSACGKPVWTFGFQGQEKRWQAVIPTIVGAGDPRL